jgi:hypothetical protein
MKYSKKITPPKTALLIIFTGLFFGLTAAVFAAKSKTADLWTPKAEERVAARGARLIEPEKYLVYELNRGGLKQIFARAPLEFSEDARREPDAAVVELPTPDGRFERFRLLESPVLSPALAAEYPDWKTFQAYGLDDPTATARLGVTLNGFHATVFSARGTFQIDPFQRGDVDNYITYFKRDLTAAKREFHCEVEERLHGNDDPTFSFLAPAAAFSHGSQIRTYRLAIAVTAEYTAVFGNQTAALAQVATTTNRMNGIYRRDFAVGLQLVSGTNLIYTDPGTDPYTNALNSAQLTVNQTNIDAVIGSANYDVGHLFATSNNGIAQLASICNATGKARGGSGQPNPQGDGFDVDYVAHEIGHQIGANHTFNAPANCGSSPAAARMEPGSAVSIMGYAGICSSTANLQRNSIDNFLGYNQQEAIAFLGGAGGGCGSLSGANQIPVVTAPASFTIPFNTPFTLTASAMDGDGHALTYSWEQNTPGGSTSSYPGTTDDDDTNLGTNRVLFRPYSPSSEPTRMFPSLPYILNNANEAPVTYTGTSATGSICAATCITGEDLPSVARTINFRVTVRDNFGGVADAATDVVFVNTTTPFAVTAPNTNVTWNGTTNQTVTWNVSATNAAPINTATVNILLSTDGGQTFPIVLAAGTPNDGSQSVTVPNLSTTQARIKVEAVGNIFFDVSNANFTINVVTAANVSVAGRVLTADGARGVSGATVALLSQHGETVYARTNSFGYFRFNDVQAGATYVLSVRSKRYQFAERVVSTDAEAQSLTITALP